MSGWTTSNRSSASNAVARDLDPEALAAQPDHQRLDEALLVLDDEHRSVVLRHSAATAGMRHRERGTLALDRLHPDLAVVVGGDVAHDRQTEPGATGVPAARPIDAVEPLEDPVEVARRDADRRDRATANSIQRAVGAARDSRTSLPGSLYFTALSTRLPSADTSCRRSPSAGEPVGSGCVRCRRRCRAARRARRRALDDLAQHVVRRRPARAPRRRRARCATARAGRRSMRGGAERLVAPSCPPGGGRPRGRPRRPSPRRARRARRPASSARG